MLVALAPGDAPGTLDLNKLFIEPLHIRGSRPCAARAPGREARAGVEVFGQVSANQRIPTG